MTLSHCHRLWHTLVLLVSYFGAPTFQSVMPFSVRRQGASSLLHGLRASGEHYATTHHYFDPLNDKVILGLPFVGDQSFQPIAGYPKQLYPRSTVLLSVVLTLVCRLATLPIYGFVISWCLYYRAKTPVSPSTLEATLWSQYTRQIFVFSASNK
jgi:hypothetical protein